MKMLVDAQLPPLLADWLVDRGHQAIHVAAVGLLAAPDVQLVDWAVGNAGMIVSKDADFRLLRHPDRFGLLWLRCGNMTRPALLPWLAARWDAVETLLAQGERFIELR